jgi:flagellar protein FlbD
MISVSRLNGSSFVLNCDIIETIEETPDTVISTTNGKKFVVKESIEQIVEKVLKYKNEIQNFVKKGE